MFKFSTRSLECKSKMFGGDTKTYDHNLGVDHQQGTTNLLGSIRRGMYVSTNKCRAETYARWTSIGDQKGRQKVIYMGYQRYGSRGSQLYLQTSARRIERHPMNAGDMGRKRRVIVTSIVITICLLNVRVSRRQEYHSHRASKSHW